MIVALVLAAGGSTRMGRPKQLLPYGGGTLLEAALAPYLAAPSVDRVIVVVGCRAGEVAAAVPQGDRVDIVRNPRWALGMASSIRCGVRAVAPDAGAILLGLGDQPRVTTAAVERVVAAWRAGRPRPPIVIPMCAGRRGHPVLFDRALRAELTGLRGDRGARAVVERHAAGLVLAKVRCPGILQDVDTPAEYDALRERAS
ncbi:MAG TPA: nucleotidyltransferase family protein [Polyangia bacterium]|jgi:molybdenum cofactor cytidylyltransferase